MADLEPGFEPGGNGISSKQDLVEYGCFRSASIYPGGKMPTSTAGREARRYS